MGKRRKGSGRERLREEESHRKGKSGRPEVQAAQEAGGLNGTTECCEGSKDFPEWGQEQPGVEG